MRVPSMLILNRVRFHGRPDLAALRQYHANIGAALERVPGFLGWQVWVDVYEPSRFLTAHVYRDLTATEQGLLAIMDEPLVQEYVKLGHDSPDTVRVRVIESAGSLTNDITDTEFISTSVRIAEPGRTNQLHDDLRRVFSECAMIDGFTGYLIGVNDVLEEETVGIAGWLTQKAFEQSVPRDIIAKVRCYAKAFPPHAKEPVTAHESAGAVN